MSFFKAYDMRGTFGSDFDLDLVESVGRALPSVIPGQRWLVGRDCRVTSPDVRTALLSGLTAAGVNVTDLGLCTTPMVYFFTAADGYDGSVMVTASHNPPSDNGLKVSRRTALPVGFADGLDRVEKLVAEMRVAGQCAQKSVAHADTSAMAVNGLDRYLNWMKSRAGSAYARSNLRIAVDCSNGMSSLLVRELFPNAVIINDTPDGRFPAHSPNPLKEEARQQLASVVRSQHLDCGVIFDGDADRAMFVDETGAFVQPDFLIPIVAAATSRAATDASLSNCVLHDVRTSRGAIEALRDSKFEPIMVQVGHAFAKPQMRSHSAICGGELAGHYYFGEFFGCDSGALAALRILDEFATRRCAAGGLMTFSEMMQPIVSRYANSGELNFRVDDKDAAVRRVVERAAKDLPAEIGRSNIDGLRVEFADGWFNIRKSNTEPYLRLIVEARTKPMLADWVGTLSGAIKDAR